MRKRANWTRKQLGINKGNGKRNASVRPAFLKRREAFCLFLFFEYGVCGVLRRLRKTCLASSRAHSVVRTNEARSSKAHVHPHEVVLMVLQALHARRHAHSDCVRFHAMLPHGLHAGPTTTRRRVHA
jgi:hypothetical protein